ncbi:MAG TPA: phosphoadenylyl-sulfate reductase, partial [Cytophagales bacterium]|nr:phosphoadenylyl-sulfate reductase [Cytophagales bacterium]
MKPESESVVAVGNGGEHLSPTERLAVVFDQYAPEEILVTTSLGTSSALLLHVLSRVAPQHPIYFVDTGYHFAETLHYGQYLQDLWGLNLVYASPTQEDHAFTKATELWKTQPDQCCALNKVQPVNRLKQGKKVWVSGLMRYQNANRAYLDYAEPKGGLTKVYPLLDMTEEEVHLYQLLYELPKHPLLDRGYDS